MAEKILSQWEIDALLQSMAGTAEATSATATGEGAQGRNIKPYDFRRPDRFSKDHLRALRTIHEAFARNVGPSLSSYLRTNARLHLTVVEQTIFDEYTQQLPDPTLIYIVQLNPLQGHGILEFNLTTALAMLDRLCGGPGVPPPKARELTEIEVALLRSVGQQLLRVLAEAWSSVLPLEPVLDDILLKPGQIRSISPNEIVALLVLEMTLGQARGTMSLCLPHPTLDPILPRLHTQAWAGGRRPRNQEEYRDLMVLAMQDVPLDLVAELGVADVSIAELADLRENDVIRLTTRVDGEITLLVEGIPKFRCRPGTVSGNIAVQITDVIKEGVNE